MEKEQKKEKPFETAEFDPEFKSEVLSHKEAERLNACFACGTCTAGCPIHEIFPEYDPRKLAKMVKLGMRKEVLASPYIWYCATCHNCEQRCPQNVKFFDVLNILKNMAAQQGYAPHPWIEQTQQIMRNGMIFPVTEELNTARKALSLPALENDGNMARKIIKLTGIDRMKAQKKR
ncbi:MAG: 4Fe-4S dicluster domain-containing protein [Acidobacteriota bacterium]